MMMNTSELQNKQRQIERLRQENEKLRKDNRELRNENAELRKKKEELEAALADAKRQAAPFRKKTKKKQFASNNGERRKPGRARGHEPAYRQPPDREPDYTIDVPLCSCPICGGVDFDQAKTIEQTVEDIPEPRIVVTKYNIETGRCTSCGKRVRGRHPTQVSNATGCAGTQIGPRAAALSTELKHRFGASYRKTSDLLNDAFGLKTTAGGLFGIDKRMAQRFTPTFDELIRDLRRSAMVNVDETGWPLEGKNGWMWVFVAIDTCIYKITPTRKGDIVRETLALDDEANGFQGTLGSDGYIVYDSLIPDERHQQCLGHILKRAADLRDALKGMAVRFPLAVLELFRDAIGAKVLKTILQDFPSNEGRLSFYADYVAWIEDRLDRLLARPPTPPESAKFHKHIRKHKGQLLNFLYNDVVAPTNNAAERALRPGVIARKTTGGNRTILGAWVHEVLASVSATCRLRGHPYLDVAQLAYCGQPVTIPKEAST